MTALSSTLWPRLLAALLGLAALAGLGILVGGLAYWQRRGQVAWRASLRRAGWLASAASAAALAGVIAVGGLQGSGNVEMAVEIVMPLAVAVQATHLLTPNDEPPLEVFLSCPRPAPWLFLERMAVVLAVQGGIGLVGTAASMAIAGESDVLLALARWLPPSLFFGGAAAALTIRTREPALGLAVTALSCAGALLGRNLLLPAEVLGFYFPRPLHLLQPVLWLVHPYLQPGMLSTGDYVVNRLVLAGAGCLLIALAASSLRDAERVLLGVRAGRPAFRPKEDRDAE